MATSLDLARTYTSYSGVDIRVVINGAQVGSMQALSYAIQREKAPIYVMGSVDPISYSRGKRGIAGTMISLMMDTHILMSPSFTGEVYLGDNDEIFPALLDDNGNALAEDAYDKSFSNVNNDINENVQLRTVGEQNFSNEFRFNSGVGGAGQNATGAYRRAVRETSFDATVVGNNYKVAPVFYVDQILPFDIAIVAANEYGQSAQMRLYGCEILNEGSGFSIDDIVIENQMTYVCRTILPWRTYDMQNKDGSIRDQLYDNVGSETIRGVRPGGSNTKLSYRTK